MARARERLPCRDDAAARAGTLTPVSGPTRSRVRYALDVAEELGVGAHRLSPDLPEPLLDSCPWRLVALTRSPGAEDQPERGLPSTAGEPAPRPVSRDRPPARC